MFITLPFYSMSRGRYEGVLPTITSNYVPCARERDIILLSYMSQWNSCISGQCSYLVNLFLGKFMPAVILSCHIPPLVHHIFSVVHRSSKEEVTRVTARRVITFMADNHSFRYLSVGKSPSESIRSPILPFVSKSAVSSMVLRGSPIPAFLRTYLVNFTPKNFNGILLHTDNNSMEDRDMQLNSMGGY